MGYAAYRAWTTGMTSLSPRTRELTQQGATLYTIQLGLNLLWMPLFFKYHRPIAATIDILALSGVVGYMTYVWSQVDEVAGYFLAPYLGWLGFATYLCVSIGPYVVQLLLTTAFPDRRRAPQWVEPPRQSSRSSARHEEARNEVCGREG